MFLIHFYSSLLHVKLLTPGTSEKLRQGSLAAYVFLRDLQGKWRLLVLTVATGAIKKMFWNNFQFTEKLQDGTEFHCIQQRGSISTNTGSYFVLIPF